MKVFISGGITGVNDYQKAFNDAAALLESKGFDVMNPAILPSKGFYWQDYMKITMAMLDACEAVLMLPGWQKSTGSNMEHKRAESKKLQIFEDINELLKMGENNEKQEQ